MEPFTLHILGCGSAKPSNGHLPSCQVLNLRGKLYMIDCGEGAQMQWSRMGLGMTRLGHIFISHSHGDHCFGLPGLISTMGLLGRTADLHIHAPADLQEFVECILKNFCQEMDYKVFFHEIDTKQFQLIFEDRSVEVWSLPLKHRTLCTGFLFKEKPMLPHIRPEMIEAYGIPVSQINNIKAGLGWENEDGEFIPSERLTRPADPSRSYAYCSDTMYKPSLAEYIKGVDLLYHEATFGEEYMKRAQQTGHSTARQAGMMAKLADVKQLLIGHYSGRVKNETAHLKEAQAEFDNVLLGKEGLVVSIQ